MVAALSGDRVGRLHPDTPRRRWCTTSAAELERHGLDGQRQGRARPHRRGAGAQPGAAPAAGAAASPAASATSGPADGRGPGAGRAVAAARPDQRLPALIEAGAHGATLADAAAARADDASPTLAPRSTWPGCCSTRRCAGRPTCPAGARRASRGRSARRRDLGALGDVLAAVLGAVAARPVLGTAGSPLLAAVLGASVRRVLWLAEGMHGGPAPAEPRRLDARWSPARDAILHVGDAVRDDRESARGGHARIAATARRPPDLRGAAFGLRWSLGDAVTPRTRRSSRGDARHAGRLARGAVRAGPRGGAAADGSSASLDELVGAHDRARLPGGAARAAAGVRVLPAARTGNHRRAAAGAPRPTGSGARACCAGASTRCWSASGGGRWRSASTRCSTAAGLADMSDRPTGPGAVAADARRAPACRCMGGTRR